MNNKLKSQSSASPNRRYRQNKPRKASTLVLPRQVGLALPDRYICKLRYWKSIQISLNVSNTQAIRFSPSNAYDVDPLLASTAMSGYVELAAIYGAYRVTGSDIMVEATNSSPTHPVRLIVGATNVDPGGTPSAAYVLSLAEQPYAKSTIVSLAGGPASKIKNQLSTERIYGNPMVKYDDNFSAPTTASPSNNWWWVIGIYAQSLFTQVFTVNVTMEVDIEFYNRNFLQN
jgi:hypothetical protein